MALSWRISIYTTLFLFTLREDGMFILRGIASRTIVSLDAIIFALQRFIEVSFDLNIADNEK